MANYNVVSREDLKKALNKQAESFAPNGEVMIGSARLITGDLKNPESKKLQLQFIQVRNLTGAKKSLMSMANKGDSRFDMNNTQVLRNWFPITVEGGGELFGLDFQSMFEQAEKLTDTDELFIGHIMGKVTDAEGVEADLRIQVKETTDIKRLPKAIKASVEANDEYSEFNMLRAPIEDSEELEPVVDENGLPVYRWTELVTSDVADVLVPNKKTLSRFIEDGGVVNEEMKVAKKLVPEGRNLTI